MNVDEYGRVGKEAHRIMEDLENMARRKDAMAIPEKVNENKSGSNFDKIEKSILTNISNVMDMLERFEHVLEPILLPDKSLPPEQQVNDTPKLVQSRFEQFASSVNDRLDFISRQINNLKARVTV